MIRQLHRWPALFASILLIILSLSGAALSVFPALERVTAPAASQDQSVAVLAAMVRDAHPGVEQIKRAPSGKITVWWFEGDAPGSAVFDPVTGRDAGSADTSQVERWLVTLHRALFLDDTGRIVMASAAGAMLVLTISGALLVVRRVGGWRKWFARQNGPSAGRLHTVIARIGLPFLALSAITALWMVASTFDLLPSDTAAPMFPAQVSGDTGLAVSAIETLQATAVADLRDLTFPAVGDASDVYTLTTATGAGFIDQGNGTLLVWETAGIWSTLFDWVYLLHTGQGAALWGLILGVSVLSVPVLTVTGTLSWLRGRGNRPRLQGMATASRAETVILVGSEGGSTWGFAATLAKDLQAAGHTVQMAPLSGFAPQTYTAAQRIIVMTATWGDGTAPTSANGALARLAAAKPTVPLAVLGFGDRSFPAFCAYAKDFEAAARANGWSLLLPLGEVDRQSDQDFARWGRALGAALDLPLTLTHRPVAPRSLPMTLVSRREYGEAVQAPAAILRFAVPQAGIWQRLTGRGFGKFQAGDLLGIVPEGSTIPRFYSLASCRADGFVEIVIRKHQGGLCSGQLIDLQAGQSVQAFVRPNPVFRADRTRAPLILIGAGTGIGPLAGFIRAQGDRRRVHLWFGARHPETDLFYGEELGQWADNGQLAGLHTAFSRSGERHYVQDALRRDARTVQDLIASGARIMVCGGRDMSDGVRAALADILSPLRLSVTNLKSEGRYVEDVY